MITKLKIKNGFSLLEVILSSALLSMFVVIFIGAILDAQDSVVLTEKRKTAVRIAETGLEVVRNIRDSNFTNLIDGNYGVSSAGGQWILLSTSDVTDNLYTRTINISSVDAKTKKINSQVVWAQNERRSGEINLTTYLTDQRI